MPEYNISGQFTGTLTADLPSSRQIITVQDGESIASAVSIALENSDIIIEEGNFIESQTISLKDGQRLIGEGVVNISSNQNYLILIDGVKNVAIQNIEISGGKVCDRGIYAINSEGIFIKDVFVIGMNFSGMMFFKNENIVVKNCKIHNSSELNTSGNFATGNIIVSGVEGAIFENISINDFAENYGYGIKVFDFVGERKAKNLVFENIRIAIEGVSLWSTENQVPSFAMEFYNIDAENIVIKNCDFKNMISFSYDEYLGDGIRFFNNNCDPVFGEAIELRAKGLKIYSNVIKTARANPLVNYGSHRTSDIEIRNNKIYCGYERFNEGIITLKDEMEGLKIIANDFYIHQSWGMPLLYLGGGDGSTHKDIEIFGNTVHRLESLHSGGDMAIFLENGNDYEDFTIECNIGDNFPIERCEYEDDTPLSITKIANREI